jgi:alpha-tubulin suppressor-like RCC1 family protein
MFVSGFFRTLVGVGLVFSGLVVGTGVDRAGASTATLETVVSGGSDSCALLDNGLVKCWGLNDDGELGLGDTASRGDGPSEMGDDLPIVDLGTGRTATAISVGDAHTCALLDTGTVKCWGLNDFGQLGLGDTATRGDGPNEMGDNLPTVDLGTGRTAVAIAAGQNHTCAILDDGTVKCWGSAEYIGLENNENRGDRPNEMGDNLPAVNLGTGRTAVAITASYTETCALLDNGSVKCWGQNDFGQLGLGNRIPRGGAPGDMGDNLPAIDLGTGRTAVSISTGGDHTCAVLDNGSVKCWGYNSIGQLGLGVFPPVWKGDDPNEMGDNLPAVDLGTGRTALEVVAGANHSCALLDNGSVKCWGEGGLLGNESARTLGEGVFNGDFLNHNEMGDNLPSVLLGTGRTAVAITGGDATHTCAQLDNGSVKCWGYNQFGQLGIGSTMQRGIQPGEMGDNLPAVDLTDTERSSIVIAPSPLPPTTGSVQYSVTVSGIGGPPTGSVTISDDQGGSCQTATITAGGAGSCALTESAASSPYTIAASYPGDSNYLPSSASISVASNVSSGGTATSASGEVTATAVGGTDGTDTLTATRYAADPVGAPSFNAAGKYFDVVVSSGSSFSSATIVNCDVGSGSILEWWNPSLNAGIGGWTPVTGNPGPTYDAGPPACVSVTLDGTTSPTVSQLSGTVFGLALPTITGSLQITTPGLPAATLGTPYAITLTAVNGTGIVKWKKTGKLPLGLKLNPKTGVISGTPKKKTGTFTFTIVVKDSSRRPKHQASQVFTIKVH